MKKFLIIVVSVIVLVLLLDTAYYRWGLYLPLPQTEEPEVWATTEGKTIYVKDEPFLVKGVDMGTGYPGAWATDYAINKETYLRWFKLIQEMGANTIRVYTVQQDTFYNAFYEYNKDNPDPLYLLHGLWINDYVINSRLDAFDDEFLGELLSDGRTLVDVLHGHKKLSPEGLNKGSGTYTKDISDWVLGYILGVEWETGSVVYTDQVNPDKRQYVGTYFYTQANASPYESMLAQLGDEVVRYETQRYGQQRLVAFSNWAMTDPFVYPVPVSWHHSKLSCIDVEHIHTTVDFQSGQFVSYHVYPYYPDFLQGVRESAAFTEEELDARLTTLLRATIEDRLAALKRPSVLEFLDDTDFTDPSGEVNTYYSYLKLLNDYHTHPVVIAEFGTTTGRTMAQTAVSTGRNQGGMSEQEQGQAILDCWRDILDAGCAGGCIFSWQDEWFKRTWNTLPYTDLDSTAFWNDAQTNDQHFGLLTFEPGKTESVCYVDGDDQEWTESDLAAVTDRYQLSIKYDVRSLYLLVEYEGEKPEALYLPFDTTQKSGSTTCERNAYTPTLTFDRAADFLLVLKGETDSRLLVQERYDAFRANYSQEFFSKDVYVDPPEPDSPVFGPINLPLTLEALLPNVDHTVPTGTYYETGLLTHGNANPASPDFDSLADFCFGDGFVEVRLPWLMLNIGDPSSMRIHDDYYECYGVEFIPMDCMYVSVGDGTSQMTLSSFPLKDLGRKPAFHERLKAGYEMVKAVWTEK